VVLTILLPCMMIADSLALAGKCTASRAWFTKPANAGLQFRNLVSAERDGHLSVAYQTVGAFAILDEQRFSKTRVGWCEFLRFLIHQVALFFTPVDTPTTAWNTASTVDILNGWWNHLVAGRRIFPSFPSSFRRINVTMPTFTPFLEPVEPDPFELPDPVSASPSPGLAITENVPDPASLQGRSRGISGERFSCCACLGRFLCFLQSVFTYRNLRYVLWLLRRACVRVIYFVLSICCCRPIRRCLCPRISNCTSFGGAIHNPGTAWKCHIPSVPASSAEPFAAPASSDGTSCSTCPPPSSSGCQSFFIGDPDEGPPPDELLNVFDFFSGLGPLRSDAVSADRAVGGVDDPLYHPTAPPREAVSYGPESPFSATPVGGALPFAATASSGFSPFVAGPPVPRQYFVPSAPSTLTPEALISEIWEVPSQDADALFTSVNTQPVSGLPAAERAVIIDEQQSSFTTGAPLKSTTVHSQSTTKESGYSSNEGIGSREATARFPCMSEKDAYLFNNNPANLRSSNTKRNVGVGKHQPSAAEAAGRDAACDWIKKNVFTKRNIDASIREYDSIASTFPKRLGPADREKWHLEALNEATSGNGYSYSKLVKAFVKSEVSSKAKPRPIANHGVTRLVALAKVAFIFDTVMFDKLEGMSIKHRAKREVMRDIAKNMNGIKRGGKAAGSRWGENDLTAFEFGIGEDLKRCECEILTHIGSLVGLEDVSSVLFERVVADRLKPIVWKMSFVDECGVKQTYKLHQQRAMRESGDRLTSSGNFFQNWLAWTSFLVHPDHIESAMRSLLSNRGERFVYVSARDGKKYTAMFVFEGDDTICRCQEAIWLPAYSHAQSLSFADDFFFRWGWSPKLTWKNETGFDYVRFVGYDILLNDNEAVFSNNDLVSCPEILRILNTKQWSLTAVTPEEKKTCAKVYALAMAEEFCNVAPMYYFFKALYEHNVAATAIVRDEKVRELSLLISGVLPSYGDSQLVRTLINKPFPEFQGGNQLWTTLCRVSAGQFDAREWATSCSEPNINVHGADLALHYPASWIGRVTRCYGAFSPPPGLQCLPDAPPPAPGPIFPPAAVLQPVRRTDGGLGLGDDAV
jgi:hypothetical protein